MTELFRTYPLDECGPDGYPYAWHRCPECIGGRVPYGPPDEDGEPQDWDQCGACLGLGSIKDLVRFEAGDRCVRCGHPYAKGEHPLNESGESWSPCDEGCHHEGAPFRWRPSEDVPWKTSELYFVPYPGDPERKFEEAFWRILTVHHLDEDKANCRWWNLAALCQRCHLRMQRAVVMGRPYHFEHSEWFKPYAAGFYAWKYLDEDLTREETTARLEELLALEHRFTQEALI